MHMEQLHSTLVVCFLLVFLLDGITPSSTPDASLLCISECGTCPLICSPPPSAVSKPPPSAESKPPPPVDSEPPPYLTPIYHPTPPQSYSPTPPPPPPRTRAKSCPPPSYITVGTNAPPPPKLVVVPSTQIPPSDGVGQKNFSYPYYYFYASNGVAFSQGFSRFLNLFTCFYFIFLFKG
ncbi:hypothetical protein L1987_30233 [Smallanthus sonchifolius]|uniref:Uncharacterized protein n=1 Tax=Smallanthus sonchifolius TaxID=185202 RepID=A0ACB9I309_9ASTR|nr:hypothetical protein L1987_30233 [Smallanthus sonchifolius]